ncbi:MAG: hypothetical protein IJ400_05845 [Clostridia bacterium]|nr:hypothetical protein [Clostridia bacterium]
MKKLLCIIFCISLAISMLVLTACDPSTEQNNLGTGSNNVDLGIVDDQVASVEGNNVFLATYEDMGNGTVIATVYVAGTVSYAGFVGELKYDSSVLSVIKCEPTTNVVVGINTPGEIAFSCGTVNNVTTVGSIFTVEFSYSGSVKTLLDLEVSEVANASLQDVEFSARDVEIEIN